LRVLLILNSLFREPLKIQKSPFSLWEKVGMRGFKLAFFLIYISPHPTQCFRAVLRGTCGRSSRDQIRSRRICPAGEGFALLKSTALTITLSQREKEFLELRFNHPASTFKINF
jgi:hypothetical protein